MPSLPHHGGLEDIVGLGTQVYPALNERERESVRERDREKPKERRDMGRMRELNTRQYRVKINPSDILNATVILSDNRNEPVKILNTHPCIYLFMLAPQVESALDATMCNHSP